MANLDSLVLLDPQSGLYSLETRAALGHRWVQVMLQEFLREIPSHPVPRAGRAHQANQGLRLNLCCQGLPGLHGGRQNLYWRSIQVNKTK